MRHLGIDFGTKKIGLALSDESGAMGFPYGIVPNDSRLLQTVLDIIKKEGVQALVLGESLDRNGEENPVMVGARQFAAILEAETGLPVFFEFEAFTTQEASRGFEGERTQGQAVDASAAALILTSYLSHK